MSYHGGRTFSFHASQVFHVLKNLTCPSHTKIFLSQILHNLVVKLNIAPSEPPQKGSSEMTSKIERRSMRRRFRIICKLHNNGHSKRDAEDTRANVQEPTRIRSKYAFSWAPDIFRFFLARNDIISDFNLPGDKPSHYRKFEWDNNLVCFYFPLAKRPGYSYA